MQEVYTFAPTYTMNQILHPNRLFILGAGFEAGLLVAGSALCWIFGLGFLSNFHWDGSDALLSLAAVLPLLALFFSVLRSNWRPLREIRDFLDQEGRQLFQGCQTTHLLTLSVLAGVGEELFFRGAIQGGLAKLVGELPALVLASLIFGCLHPMTWGYLILASIIGVYLGALWLWTGNLLVPAIAHAVYDFVALVYLMKVRRGSVEQSAPP
jgi:membrane protease YdiL (CAAX protease family)